jgi:hypothetical protein
MWFHGRWIKKNRKMKECLCVSRNHEVFEKCIGMIDDTLIDIRACWFRPDDIDPESDDDDTSDSDDDEGTAEGYLAGSLRRDNFMRIIIDEYNKLN